jgi:imidazolonepropionase-like amidohydrolase
MRRSVRVVLALVLLSGIVVAVFIGRMRPRLATVRAAPGSSRAVLFKNVSVFDGESMLRERDVLISGSTISAITATRQSAPPADATTIEGAGKTLLPGLIDCHVHLLVMGGAPWKFYLPNPAGHAQALLYAGVTSALIAQSSSDEPKLRREAAAGRALSPHLFTAGPGLTAPGGHPIPFMRILLPWPLGALIASQQPTVAGPEEAPAKVAEIKRRYAPPFLKIFYDSLPPGTPQLSLQTLTATVQAARAEGLRPVVHIGGGADMVAAAEAGASLLMHPPSRDALTEAQLARLAQLKVPFVTTMAVLQSLLEVARGGGNPLEREIVEDAVLAAFAHPPRGWTFMGFDEQDIDKAVARMRDNVRRLVQAGVPFFVGTDSGVFGVLPGAAMHRELAELYRLGLPPLSILRAATSAPAAFLDEGRGFGRIAAGQRADLLLVRGDPSADAQALSNIEEVFLSGARLVRQRAAP